MSFYFSSLYCSVVLKRKILGQYFPLIVNNFKYIYYLNYLVNRYYYDGNNTDFAVLLVSY